MGIRIGEALRAAESSGSEALRVLTLTFSARRHIVLGNLNQGRRMLDESIHLATLADNKRALIGGLGWRGVLHYFQSEFASAERALARTLELSSELRDSFMLFFALYFLGLTRANLGRISDALATFDEICRLAQRNGEHYQVLKVPNSLGWIHRELGDLQGAAAHNKRGVEVARKHRVLEAEVNSIINLGCDCTCIGEPAMAQPAFTEADVLLQRDDWTRWRFSLRLLAAKCEYLLSQGDLVKTEACARELLDTAEHYEARKYAVSARNILAELAIAHGDLAAAEARLIPAVDLLHTYPAPLVAWKTYAKLARIRLLSGTASLAREAFDQASSIIRLIAGNIDDPPLRSIFLESPAVRDVLRHSSAWTESGTTTRRANSPM
jgi:tetratricopeptide (TPR) repeat protein